MSWCRNVIKENSAHRCTLAYRPSRERLRLSAKQEEAIYLSPTLDHPTFVGGDPDKGTNTTSGNRSNCFVHTAVYCQVSLAELS